MSYLKVFCFFHCFRIRANLITIDESKYIVYTLQKSEPSAYTKIMLFFLSYQFSLLLVISVHFTVHIIKCNCQKKPVWTYPVLLTYTNWICIYMCNCLSLQKDNFQFLIPYKSLPNKYTVLLINGQGVMYNV